MYAALHNVAGGERVASMKTRNAYRQVILPKYAMDIVRECREVLRKQGYGDSEINDAYVAHHPLDIYRPADPRDISRYVKNKLELLGYNSTYWCGMELVAQTEPDADERGNALTDVTAYLLRRSGCTYLCNCTSVPLPDGRSVMPHGLVDALMGHRLRGEDAWWAEWIRREDNWPIIAQVSQLYRPNRSAVPLLEALPGSSRLLGTRERKYPYIYCPAPRWAAGDPHPACQWKQPSRRCTDYAGSDQCAARRCY